MKTNSEIAHIWANQLEYNGQEANLFRRGNTIYSYGYHFPIAKHIDHKTVLMTTRGYSNSTAKHISLVRQAISHKDVIYCNNPEQSNEWNVEHFISEIRNEATNLIKAKKPEKYLIQIEYIKAQLNTYLTYFNLKLSKDQAKQIDIKSKEDFVQRVEAEKAKKLKADKKAIAMGKKLYPIYVHNFRNELKNDFTPDEFKALNKHIDSIGNPILFKVKANEIESSKGVKIPFDIAKRYINRFLNSDIKPLDRILNYPVSKVKKDLLVIGCHNIYRAEIEYLNGVLN
jgi:hypothetical protein